MQQACDVVELKWVLRRALVILNTLEVHATVLQPMACGPAKHISACYLPPNLVPPDIVILKL